MTSSDDALIKIAQAAVSGFLKTLDGVGIEARRNEIRFEVESYNDAGAWISVFGVEPTTEASSVATAEWRSIPAGSLDALLWVRPEGCSLEIVNYGEPWDSVELLPNPTEVKTRPITGMQDLV
jgi:hypothetical protein